MILSSLLALSLSLSYGYNSSNFGPAVFESYTREYPAQNVSSYIQLPSTDYLGYHYSGTFFRLGNSWTAVFEPRFSLHYDDSYNEYLQINFLLTHTSTDNYFSVEGLYFLHDTYNVSYHVYFYLYDDNDIVVKTYNFSGFLLKSETSSLNDFGFSDGWNVPSTVELPLHIEGFVDFDLLPDQTLDPGDSYQQGYDDGYGQGYGSGYQNGKTDGTSEGQGLGYHQGYEAGKLDGYSEGYNVALNTHDFSFTNLFASISDTPILFIRRMFNFGIFGVSAISILLSLFTCLIFIKIIKKVW